MKKKSGRESLFLTLSLVFDGQNAFSTPVFFDFFNFFHARIFFFFHVLIFGFLHGQKIVFTGKNLRIFTGSILFSRAIFEPTSPLFSGTFKPS